MFGWFKKYQLKQVCYMYLSNSKAISIYIDFYKSQVENEDNYLVNCTWLKMFERLSKENHLIYDKLKTKQYTREDIKKMININKQLKDHYKIFPTNQSEGFAIFVTPLFGWDRAIDRLIEELNDEY